MTLTFIAKDQNPSFVNMKINQTYERQNRQHNTHSKFHTFNHQYHPHKNNTFKRQLVVVMIVVKHFNVCKEKNA